MTTRPSLSKAPIVEGLIDLRVERSSRASVDAFVALAENFAAEFPSRKQRSRFMAQIHFGPGAAPASSKEEADGVVLRSVDEKWVVQLHLDGLTVSRLQPYGSWADLLAKSTEWWGRYRDVAQPDKVIRIATRFINRIPLPPGEPFDRTFLTMFTLGPTLPQAVTGYLQRVVIPFEADAAVAVLTQSLEGDAAECILDIDVSAERPNGFREDETWQKIDVLRRLKNQLFFGSLTTEALERFK